MAARRSHRQTLVFFVLISLFACATSNGSTAEQLYRQARKAQRKEKNDQALLLYKKAAEQNHVAAKCFTAVLVDETQSATVALDAILKQHPKNSACLLLQAREVIFAGHIEQGQKLATAAIQYGPDDPLTWATLGFAEFRRQEYLAAAKAFEKSVALDDEITQNVFNVGYAYYLGGEYPTAQKWLGQVLAIEALGEELEARAQTALDTIRGGIWICPMHTQITGKKDEVCSICKMNLEPVSRGIASE